jgi:hypothetical protein
MQHCIDTTQTACHQYAGKDGLEDLNEFLLANHGKPAQTLDDGTAIFSSTLKGVERLMWVREGSWVQAKAMGGFFTHTDERFRQRFALVDADPVQTEMVKKEGVLAGIKKIDLPVWLSKIMSRQKGGKAKNSREL